MSNTSQKDIDESGILSAIWILACNDENPLLLYDSTIFRLGLPESYDLEGLIKRHGELFRQKCPEFRLEEWKKEMLKGNHLPLWIREIEDTKERKALINSLEPDDVFRSQFRANAKAPRSDISIIDWGLEHIERIRKAKIETKEEKWKFLKEGVIPIVSIVVALIAVIASSLIQYINIGSQEELKKYEINRQEELKKYEIDKQKESKKYEVSFKLRIDIYISLMRFFETAFEHAKNRDRSKLQRNLSQMEFDYYQIRPFLSEEAQKTYVKNYNEYSSYLNKLFSKGLIKNLTTEEQESYEKFKLYFGETLPDDLFEKSQYIFTNFNEMRILHNKNLP